MTKIFFIFLVCALIFLLAFTTMLNQVKALNQEIAEWKKVEAEWYTQRNFYLSETRRLEAGLQFFIIMADHKGTMKKPYHLKPDEVIFLPSISYINQAQWTPGSGRIISGDAITFWSPTEGVIVEMLHDDATPEIDYEATTNKQGIQ